MAWKVNQGAWKGTDLSGLCVAAAVRGTTTFSEDQPDKAAAVLIVDQKASPPQREALVKMAQELGGARLRNVVAVKTARMSLKLEDHQVSAADLAHSAHGMPHAPRASFWAAGLAQIVTRPLDENDHFCGNEVIAYAPLSQGVKVLPAYTLGHEFKGDRPEHPLERPQLPQQLRRPLLAVRESTVLEKEPRPLAASWPGGLITMPKGSEFLHHAMLYPAPTSCIPYL